MAAIVDLFIYSGEPIAELRVEYLYEVVDQFVIVEVTESDNTEFDKHKGAFEPFRDKIQYLRVHPSEKQPFAYAQTHIRKLFDTFIVMACDVEGIPSIETVRELPSRYFGLQHPTPFQLRTFDEQTTYSSFCVNDMSITLTDIQCSTARYIPMAGWHIHRCSTIPSHVILPTKFLEFNEKLKFLHRYAAKWVKNDVSL